MVSIKINMKSDRVARRATKRRGHRGATAEESECVLRSQAAVEPDMGDKAPSKAAHDLPDTGDNTDDVEFPEAVVLVGKTHWRCVTCMTLHPRTFSIDEHINTYHKEPESPTVLPCQDGGQGLEQDKACKAASQVSGSDTKQTTVQASAHNVNAVEGHLATCENEAVCSKTKLAKRKGWDAQRARASKRGRGGGGRGRGKLVQPPSSEDSDTEIEVSTLSPPPIFSNKENTESSFSGAVETLESSGSTHIEHDIIVDTVEDVGPPPSKRAKLKDNDRDVDVVSPNEMVTEVTPASPENISWATLKELMKAKYVMLLKKGGTMNIPLEPQIHVDNDPPIPIETPSLQADAFLPPATPLLPDIHGQPETPIPPGTPHPLQVAHQPETPILPGTPHPLEVAHQPETPILPGTPHPLQVADQPETPIPPGTPQPLEVAHQAETSIPPGTPHPLQVAQQPGALSPSQTSPENEQDVGQPQFVPSAVLATKSAVVSGHWSKSVEMAHEHGHLVSTHFSSETFIANTSPGKEITSASVCSTCGAAFDLPDDLAQHLEEMAIVAIVSCNSCGEKFHGFHPLNIHVFTTHEECSKKFCFLCGADCVDIFKLEEHLLEHSVETDAEGNGLRIRHHRCKSCGQELVGNESDLTNHYFTTHGEIFCAKCCHLFHDSTEYEQHRSIHMSHLTSVVYACPVSDCYQVCKDKQALMDHISWHEDRDLDEELQSVVQCRYCSDQFRNITSLQCHLAETHNEPGLRPFVCELCKKDFGRSVELNEHNRTYHAGIKRFGCAYCHQRFASQSAHRNHVASAHDVAATVLRM